MSEQRNRGALSADGAQVVGNESSRHEVGIVRPGAEPIQHERPEDWGWHAETGRWGRRAAWVTVLIMLALLKGNHQGRVEDLWVLGIAAALAGVLIWDIFRRRNAWRS